MQNWYIFPLVPHLLRLVSEAEDMRWGEVGVPGWMGGKYIRGAVGERINSVVGTRTVPPILYRAEKRYLHGCPDMVKLVGYGSCSA